MAWSLRARGFDAVSWSTFLDPSRLPHLREVADQYVRTAVPRLEAERWGFRGQARPELGVAALDKLGHRALEQLLIAEMGRGMVQAGLTGVCVHEDVTPGVRALLAATKGVPSVHVPHGVYVKERIVGADVHGKLHCDRVAVGGAQQAGWFLDHGVSPARITMTGNPAWDRLCNVDRESFPPLACARGLVITFAASWCTGDFHRWQHARWTHAALRGAAILAQRRPVTLIVKLHPSAPPGDEERLTRGALACGISPAMVLRGDAVPILARSDVLVTLPSTIAIEAALLGTPVVAPEFDYDGLPAPLAEPEVVADAIADAQPPGADFCARYNGECDGRAGERVAAMLTAAS